MRWISASVVLGIALASLAMLAAQSPAADKPDPRRLGADDLKAMLDVKEKLFLLDVREPRELEEEGALEGAVNIPLGTLEMRMAEVPKGVRLISICRRAHRAAQAADLLEKNGYTSIHTFAMNDWKEKGYPLVHPKAEDKK